MTWPQNPEYGWRGFCLLKYTKEFKIKLVREHISGESDGREMLAKKYDIPDGTLRNYINILENHWTYYFNYLCGRYLPRPFLKRGHLLMKSTCRLSLLPAQCF